MSPDDIERTTARRATIKDTGVLAAVSLFERAGAALGELTESGVTFGPGVDPSNLIGILMEAIERADERASKGAR